MANIGDTITYSATINPNTATSYNWSITGGGNIVGSNTNSTVQVNWTTAGSWTVNLTASNACSSVPDSDGKTETVVPPQYWNATLCSDGSNANAQIFDPNGNYTAGVIIKHNATGICYTLVNKGYQVSGLILNYGDVSEYGDCTACQSGSGGGCVSILSVTIN